MKLTGSIGGGMSFNHKSHLLVELMRNARKNGILVTITNPKADYENIKLGKKLGLKPMGFTGKCRGK